MANYNEHIAFALLLTFPLFPDVFPLALAIFGASLPDFDLKIKTDQILLFLIMGIVTSVLFYFSGLPYLLGSSLISIAFIFYLSRHRGFTHSLVGIFCLSILLTILTISLYWLLFFSVDLSQAWSLCIIILLFGLLAMKRNVISYYVLISMVGILITPFPGLDLYNIWGPLFIGLMSHVILDLFSSRGVTFLIPFYKKPIKKQFAGLFIFIWVLVVICVIKFNGFTLFGLYTIL